MGCCTESGHGELGEEGLGAGSQGKGLGPWGRNMRWGGGAGGKGGLGGSEAGKLHRAGGSSRTGQGLPMCQIEGKGDGCGRMLGKPQAGTRLEELWEERAGGINAQGRQELPVFRAARLGLESLF